MILIGTNSSILFDCIVGISISAVRQVFLCMMTINGKFQAKSTCFPFTNEANGIKWDQSWLYAAKIVYYTSSQRPVWPRPLARIAMSVIVIIITFDSLTVCIRNLVFLFKGLIDQHIHKLSTYLLDVFAFFTLHSIIFFAVVFNFPILIDDYWMIAFILSVCAVCYLINWRQFPSTSQANCQFQFYETQQTISL